PDRTANLVQPKAAFKDCAEAVERNRNGRASALLRASSCGVESRQIMSNISSTALAAHFENWELTPENIDTLPEPLRRYVHRLETISDPADRSIRYELGI